MLENVAALLTGDDGGWARYIFGRLAQVGYCDEGWRIEYHVIPAGNPNGLSAGAPHQRERVWIVAYEVTALGDRTPGQDNESGRQSKPHMGLLANGITSRLSRSRWLPEPGIGRVASGVPDRVNKLKALGNSLVWQIPHAIMQAIQEQQS